MPINPIIYLRRDGTVNLTGDLSVLETVTIDGREISRDGLRLDSHLDGQPHKHKAFNIDVENDYLWSSASDLESVISQLDFAMITCITTPERAQDIIASILLNTASIQWIYDDINNQIKAVVLPSGIHHGGLIGLGDDDHFYLLADGSKQLAGNLLVSSNKTIDGRDISVDGFALDSHVNSLILHHTSGDIQDIIGSVLKNSASVGWNYAPGNISAYVIGSGVNHSLLSGLGDDDHPQYLLTNGGRALSGNLLVNSGVAIDGRDISADSIIFNNHKRGGLAHIYDADEIDVEGTYGNIPATPCDLETAMGSLDVKLNDLPAMIAAFNWITNGDAEASTAGWTTYQDDTVSGIRVIPYDGSGGSPTLVTWSRTTSSPLDGIASFLFTKDAGNAQGEGVSFSFTIPQTIASRLNCISFDYKIESGVYNNNDVRVFIYDTVNNIITLPYCEVGLSAYGKRFIGFFNGLINSTSYRLIFHVSSANVNAFSIKIDQIKVFTDKGLVRRKNGRFRYETATADIGDTRAAAYCPTTRRLYIADYSGARVQVFNPFDLTSDGFIAVSSGPLYSSVCYCPSSDRVYVSCSGSDNVKVINPYTLTVEYTIAVGDLPYGVVYCPTNDRIYVINSGTPGMGTGAIYVINPCASPPVVVATINQGQFYRSVGYCPTANRIFAAFHDYMSTTGRVSVINPVTNTIVQTIPTSTLDVWGITYNPLDDRMYMGRYNGLSGIGYIYILNPYTGSFLTYIGPYDWLGYQGGYGLFYHPFYEKIYSFEYDVHVIDPHTRRVDRFDAATYTGYGAYFIPEAGRMWSTIGGVTRFYNYF